MNAPAKPLTEVPSKHIPFRISVVGETTGKRYEGDFIVSVPSVGDISRIGVELSRLNQGLPVEFLDENTATINTSLAFLRVALKDAPAWFVNLEDDKKAPGMNFGMDTLDYNIPREIFMAANAKVMAWRKAIVAE